MFKEYRKCEACSERGSDLLERRFTQLQLGSSESGRLTIIRPWEHSGRIPRQSYRRRPFILKLPDELIDQVLTLVTGDPGHGRMNTCKACAFSLVFVCKRFNRIALPKLYHTIDFPVFNDLVPPCMPTKRFYRTMRENAALRPLCKELYIYASDYRDCPDFQSPRNYDLANELLTWLPNVTVFSLRGGFAEGNSPYTWLMIRRAVRHMPRIAKFELTSCMSGLLTSPIIDYLDLPHLRSLTLNGIHGISAAKDGSRKPFFVPVVGKEQTGSFTTLNISDFCGHSCCSREPLGLAKSTRTLLVPPDIHHRATLGLVHFPVHHCPSPILSDKPIHWLCQNEQRLKSRLHRPIVFPKPDYAVSIPMVIRVLPGARGFNTPSTKAP